MARTGRGDLPDDGMPGSDGRAPGAGGTAGSGSPGSGGTGAWLDVEATVAERGFQASLRVAPGEVVAVLGPNGAGKSTLLSVIAGLIEADAGHVRAGSRILMEAPGGVNVPVAERRVGLLAQDALLFSSLTAKENVEFGPRSQGLGKTESAELAERWLDRVGAAELARRKPRKLSGGQAQRVAIARALAAGPEVLLLDEPMAALDVTVAARVRSMLRAVLRERAEAAGGRCSTVIVTHDMVDALTLADRILVLDNGVVADEGPVGRVVRSPRSAFAADLAGSNLVSGSALSSAGAGGPSGGDDDAASGRRGRRGKRDGRRAEKAVAIEAGAAVAAEPVAIAVPDGATVHGRTLHRIEGGEHAVAVFAPRAVAVYTRPPGGSPRNAFEVTITAVEARGDAIRVRAHCDDAGPMMAELTVAAARELDLAAGDRAVFAVKASEVRVYPS